ncbi:MAG: BON domain-containing protein [Desulfobacteraceae bacterium]|nr:BON domain-containing protein [Desulfobacteraceae bacterium]
MKIGVQLLLLLLGFSFFIASGCGPAIVGGATIATYKGTTDERTIGQMMDDSVLSANVKGKLLSDELVDAKNIDVDVVNGVVYLVGVVESDSTRRMAGDIARTIEGVRHVENQLSVGRTTTGQAFKDLYLNSKIKTFLMKDPDIKSLNIDVDTHQNVITLTGTVGSKTEKEKILSVTKDASDSARIVDNIMIND